MSTFEISTFTVEIQAGLDAIRRMAKAKISVRHVWLVEIEDEAICNLVKLMLGSAVVVHSEPAAVPPRKYSPRTAGPREMDAGEKKCAVCGEPLEANASRNAKYCTRMECKKERWRQAARKTAQVKKQSAEVVAQVLDSPAGTPAGAPGAGEEATTLAPDPLLHETTVKESWKILSGEWSGKTLTTVQLTSWLEAGSLPEGTELEHSSKGKHILGKKKDQAGLTPIPLMLVEGMPELSEQVPG